MKAQVIQQFSRRAPSYSASANWIRDPELLSAHLRAVTHPPGSALELCCGTGMVGRAFRDKGWSVCGVDLTREMAQEANEYFPCICTSADELPFLDNAFDVVLLRQAYFLLEHGQQVLSEAKRVLKPGGTLVFSQTVPYGALDAEWLEKIHRTKQAQLRQFFNESSLREELEREHFGVIGIQHLSVRENINRWMDAAPELSQEKRAEVCALISAAPESYQQLHQVKEQGGEIYENWNWVIFSASPRK